MLRCHPQNNTRGPTLTISTLLRFDSPSVLRCLCWLRSMVQWRSHLSLAVPVTRRSSPAVHRRGLNVPSVLGIVTRPVVQTKFLVHCIRSCCICALRYFLYVSNYNQPLSRPIPLYLAIRQDDESHCYRCLHARNAAARARRRPEHTFDLVFAKRAFVN